MRNVDSPSDLAEAVAVGRGDLERRIAEGRASLPEDWQGATPEDTERLRELDELREQYRWLLIIDGHEAEGHLPPARALEARSQVLTGKSVRGFRLDDTPATREWAEQQRQTTISLARFARFASPGDAAAWRLRAQVQRMDRLAPMQMLPGPRRGEPRPRPVRRRAVRRPSARGADDPEPEPPLTAGERRRGLRFLIHRAVRQQLATSAAAGFRECPRCKRDREPDEFACAAKACRDCEAERLRQYRQRSRSTIAGRAA